MQSGHGYGDDEESESMSKTTEQLKAELSDKRDRIASLEQRVSELEHERDQVAREYAESLAQKDSVVDTETMLQKFEVSELAEMYEEQESVSVTDTVDSDTDGDTDTDPKPSVRGGDGAGGESENLSAGAQQRIEELESQLSDLEGRDSRLVKARREEIKAELADIRGE
jgi:chromosome segregation ATPase